MRYVIYGAGGIGGGIGAQLALHGKDVVLIARGAHLDAIKSSGLRIKTPEGEQTLELRAVSHPEELDLEGNEVFLFTMKSQDTTGALGDLRAVAGPEVPVVLAQNGVANERMARRRFSHVYGMLVYMPALFLEAGTVVLHATPRRGTLHAGCYPTGTDETIKTVCADLRAAGFESDPDPAIMRLKYAKLMMNLGNAVQALVGIDTDTGALTKELRKEGMRCLDAAGIEFLTARELMTRCRNTYEIGTVEGSPRQGGSSWQGLMRGRNSIEADFLNGEIVLLGAEHGVDTPLNSAVQQLAVKAALAGVRPGSTTLEEIYRVAEA